MTIITFLQADAPARARRTPEGPTASRIAPVGGSPANGPGTGPATPPAIGLASPPAGHWRALDGVRGLAVVLVLASHLFQRWIPGSLVGVDLFFVLSGFLITWHLLRERDRHGTNDIRSFYMRRSLRLLPGLMALVALLVALSATVGLPGTHGVDLHSAFIAITYRMNLALLNTAHRPATPLLHTWSLAVEEQFYLLWPLALAALVRIAPRPRRQIMLLAGVVGGIAVARVAAAVAGVSVAHLYFGLDSRAVELLAGCLLAIGIARSGRVNAVLADHRLRPLAALGIAGLAVYCVAFREGHPVLYALATTAVTVVCVALIAGAIAAPMTRTARVLSTRPAVALGKLSYSLYLFHPVALLLVGSRTHSTGFVLAAQTLPLTVTLALVSYFAVEKPILRMKDNFARRTAAGATAAPVAHTAVVDLLGRRNAPATGFTASRRVGSAA